MPAVDRTILTVDLGNSSASAALVSFADSALVGVDRLASWSRRSKPAAHAAPPPGPAGTLAPLTELLSSLGSVRTCALSSVAGREEQTLVVQALEGRGLDVLQMPEPGVALRIESPETCGPDRQYAMRAALECLRTGAAAGMPSRALVVDAGTALTVDAGNIRPDGTLDFLGGAIALGPGELARSLTSAGARLPAFEIDGAVHALGRSTVEALRSGVVVGFRGAVRELAGSIAREAFGGVNGVAAFLTGGARAFAREALTDVFDGDVIDEESLVHRGLALAALDARP